MFDGTLVTASLTGLKQGAEYRLRGFDLKPSCSNNTPESLKSNVSILPLPYLHLILTIKGDLRS